MDVSKWHNSYSLLSWKLWKHLLYPRENVIFERIITQRHGYKLTMYHLCLMIVGAGVLSYAIVSFLTPLGLEFPIMVLIVLMTLSSIITVLWLVNIATNIVHEYQQATYDLIGVAPIGIMGANWSIATGILHRQDLLRWMNSARQWFSGAIFLILLSVLIPVSLSSVGDGGSTPLEATVLFVEVLVFVIFSYVEFIQTVLQGVLIALLVPRFVRRITDVTLWAIFVFIVLQVLMVTILLIGSVIIQPVFMMNKSQYPSILPQLLLFFVAREALIYSLWKLLSHQLNGELYELSQI